MRITKLPDGRLRVPLAATTEGWAADGTETIGPEDARYAEHLPLGRTEDEFESREREAVAVNAQLLARWGAHYETQSERRTA